MSIYHSFNVIAFSHFMMNDDSVFSIFGLFTSNYDGVIYFNTCDRFEVLTLYM